MRRVVRLEKLRERYRLEKEKAMGLGSHPRAEQNMESIQYMDADPDNSPGGGNSPSAKRQPGVMEALYHSTLGEITLPAAEPTWHTGRGPMQAASPGKAKPS